MRVVVYLATKINDIGYLRPSEGICVTGRTAATNGHFSVGYLQFVAESAAALITHSNMHGIIFTVDGVWSLDK